MMDSGFVGLIFSAFNEASHADNHPSTACWLNT